MPPFPFPPASRLCCLPAGAARSRRVRSAIGTMSQPRGVQGVVGENPCFCVGSVIRTRSAVRAGNRRRGTHDCQIGGFLRSRRLAPGLADLRLAQECPPQGLALLIASGPSRRLASLGPGKKEATHKSCQSLPLPTCPCRFGTRRHRLHTPSDASYAGGASAFCALVGTRHGRLGGGQMRTSADGLRERTSSRRSPASVDKHYRSPALPGVWLFRDIDCQA